MLTSFAPQNININIIPYNYIIYIAAPFSTNTLVTYIVSTERGYKHSVWQMHTITVYRELTFYDTYIAVGAGMEVPTYASTPQTNNTRLRPHAIWGIKN